MFEDIIDSNKPKKAPFSAELEKNGKMVENAVVDIDSYMNTHTGYITCPELEVSDEDCFFVYITINENDAQKEFRRGIQILVEEQSKGQFKFVIARTP